MTQEAQFRIYSLLFAIFLFAAVSAIANKNNGKSNPLSAQMDHLQEAVLINNNSLAPHKLTQIGVQKELPFQMKK